MWQWQSIIVSCAQVVSGGCGPLWWQQCLRVVGREKGQLQVTSFNPYKSNEMESNVFSGFGRGCFYFVVPCNISYPLRKWCALSVLRDQALCEGRSLCVNQDPWA